MAFLRKKKSTYPSGNESAQASRSQVQLNTPSAPPPPTPLYEKFAKTSQAKPMTSSVPISRPMALGGKPMPPIPSMSNSQVSLLSSVRTTSTTVQQTSVQQPRQYQSAISPRKSTKDLTAFAMANEGPKPKVSNMTMRAEGGYAYASALGGVGASANGTMAGVGSGMNVSTANVGRLGREERPVRSTSTEDEFDDEVEPPKQANGAAVTKIIQQTGEEFAKSNGDVPLSPPPRTSSITFRTQQAMEAIINGTPPAPVPPPVKKRTLPPPQPIFPLSPPQSPTVHGQLVSYGERKGEERKNKSKSREKDKTSTRLPTPPSPSRAPPPQLAISPPPVSQQWHSPSPPDVHLGSRSTPVSPAEPLPPHRIPVNRHSIASSPSNVALATPPSRNLAPSPTNSSLLSPVSPLSPASSISASSSLSSATTVDGFGEKNETSALGDSLNARRAPRRKYSPLAAFGLDPVGDEVRGRDTTVRNSTSLSKPNLEGTAAHPYKPESSTSPAPAFISTSLAKVRSRSVFFSTSKRVS